MTYPILNIPALDEEHKEIMFFLIQIIQDKDNLPKIINSFMSYTMEHFDREQEFMRKVNYPHIEHHIKEHERIRELIAEELIYSVYQVTEEKIEKIRLRIIAHISSFDQQLAEWYNGNN